MSLINNFRSFLLEDNFEIHIYQNKINIVNYKEIGHFDSNKVIIYSDNGYITINGTDLVVSKLLVSEVLVVGNITSIELR